MEILVSVLVSVFSAGGFWSLIMFFLQKKEKKKDLTNEGLLALLHDRLYEECSSILSNGVVTSDELDNIIHLYEPYHKLGGNGVCERMVKQISEMKIEK